MVGTWEITTTLTVYDGPDAAFACTDTSCPHRISVPPAAASLGGTLVIADSVVLVGDTLRLPVTTPTMTEADCALAPSCPSRVVSYFGSEMLFVNGRQPRWAQHATNSADILQGEVLRLAYARFAGDSIAGDVVWFPSNGVRFRSYSGTFVARRRR